MYIKKKSNRVFPSINYNLKEEILSTITSFVHNLNVLSYKTYFKEQDKLPKNDKIVHKELNKITIFNS